MCDSQPNPLEGHHSATTSQNKQLSNEDENTFQNGSFAHLSREEMLVLEKLKAHSAKIIASAFWGDDFEYLWKNKPDMEMLFDRLPLVKKTLLVSTNILCDNLKPDETLRSMKSKGALTQDDVTAIQNQTTDTKQVDKFIDVLMRKPASAYITFMDILQEERPDLHHQIKNIEEKQSLKRKHDTGKKAKKTKKKHDIGNKAKKTKRVGLFFSTLSDEDIEDIVDLLNPKELQRLFKEMNITTADIEEAIKEVNLNPKDEARLVFRRWREVNGREATRQKILDPLIACRLKYKAHVLEDKWRARKPGTEKKDPAPKVYDHDDRDVT